MHLHDTASYGLINVTAASLTDKVLITLALWRAVILRNSTALLNGAQDHAVMLKVAVYTTLAGIFIRHF
jgi:hypothetical protein